jgi:hypothetical protein
LPESNRNPEQYVPTLAFATNSLHLAVRDLDSQTANLLFGAPLTSKSKNSVTYKLQTPDGVEFLIDMVFEEGKIERYRVRGSFIALQQWQSSTADGFVPLIRICGMGFVQYSPGVHHYPVRVRTPTLSDAELRAAIQNGE